MLTVVGRGATFDAAIARAYDGVSQDFVRRHAVPARYRPEGAAAGPYSTPLLETSANDQLMTAITC